MLRILALWAVALAGFILAVVLREERLAARGRVPLGRLRRLWLKPERRRAPRYRVDWPVRYEPTPPPAPEKGAQPAQSRDVSQTGAGLVVEERIRTGQLLRIHLQPQGAAPITLTAQVLWEKEVPGASGDRRFYIGVRFREIDPEAERLLSRTLGEGKPL